MKIKFNKILDSGNAENERLLFSVLEPCNLGNYVIALAKKSGDDKISSRLEHIKWLNDVELTSKDIVVIYTMRKGNGVKRFQNPEERVSYFLFWNLEESLQSLSQYAVVCFETTWNTIDVDKETKPEIAEEGN